MKSSISLPHILTPIATAFSAVLTGWVAKHFPGLDIPSSDVVPLAVLAGVATLGSALHWLSKQGEVVKLENAVDAVADKVTKKIKEDPAASQAQADLISALRSHTDLIVKTIGNAVHAPPTVQQVAEQILTQAAAKEKPAAPAPAPVATVTPLVASTAPPAATNVIPLPQQPAANPAPAPANPANPSQ